MFHDVRYSHLQFPRARTATYLLLAGVLMGSALLLNPHIYQDMPEKTGISEASHTITAAMNSSGSVHHEQYAQHEHSVAFSSPKTRR